MSNLYNKLKEKLWYNYTIQNDPPRILKTWIDNGKKNELHKDNLLNKNSLEKDYICKALMRRSDSLLDLESLQCQFSEWDPIFGIKRYGSIRDTFYYSKVD